jgi:Arc/MetJ-type ribon-helix-helix transcriptional regulator
LTLVTASLALTFYAATARLSAKSIKSKAEAVMDVPLPADLSRQIEQELASGRYQSRDELIEKAARHFFDERQRGQRRLDALRRLGEAVEQAGLYERVLIPDQK